MFQILLCLPVVAFGAELKAVYDFWDGVNKQHTFHFPPAWVHGTTTETQNGIQFYAYDEQVTGTLPVYDWWDDANKQHTFHFEPSWRDGSEVKGDNVAFYAYEQQADGAEPVYSFWDTVNNQHTFHFTPGWPNEQQQDIQFYAFRTADGAGPTPPPTPPVPQLKNVFDFWDVGNKQHTFHFSPKWTASETQGRAQFRAWTHKTADTEAVYDYWDDGAKQHTFHFPPAWGDEVQHGLQFYAYPKDYDGDKIDLVEIHDFWDTVNKQNTFHVAPAWPNEEQRNLQFYAHKITDDTVQPVWAFWDDANKQHTFHFPPAWDHGGTLETQSEDPVFSAYTGPHEATKAVYDFWDDGAKQHTFHFEPAWGSEVKNDVRFYAFPDKANPNAEPVFDFWDSVNNQHTFHFPPAWQNEEKQAIQFYAYKNDEAAWVDPTPAPTNTEVPTEEPGEPVTKAFGFRSDNGVSDTEGFLARCNEALAEMGVQCDQVRNNEGDVEVTVTGPESKIRSLEEDGWTEVLSAANMSELKSEIEDYIPLPAGDQNGGGGGGETSPPQIGARSVNTTNTTEVGSAFRVSVVYAVGIVVLTLV